MRHFVYSTKGLRVGKAQFVLQAEHTTILVTETIFSCGNYFTPMNETEPPTTKYMTTTSYLPEVHFHFESLPSDYRNG